MNPIYGYRSVCLYLVNDSCSAHKHFLKCRTVILFTGSVVNAFEHACGRVRTCLQVNMHRNWAKGFRRQKRPAKIRFNQKDWNLEASEI